jgi:hypothetical protein
MGKLIHACALSLLLFGCVAAVGPDSTVYITKTGEKYHKGSCSSLRKSKIEIKVSEAKKRGFEPCKRCSPPSS